MTTESADIHIDAENFRFHLPNGAFPLPDEGGLTLVARGFAYGLFERFGAERQGIRELRIYGKRYDKGATSFVAAAREAAPAYGFAVNEVHDGRAAGWLPNANRVTVRRVETGKNEADRAIYVDVFQRWKRGLLPPRVVLASEDGSVRGVATRLERLDSARVVTWLVPRFLVERHSAGKRAYTPAALKRKYGALLVWADEVYQLGVDKLRELPSGAAVADVRRTASRNHPTAAERAARLEARMAEIPAKADPIWAVLAATPRSQWRGLPLPESVAVLDEIDGFDIAERVLFETPMSTDVRAGRIRNLAIRLALLHLGLPTPYEARRMSSQLRNHIAAARPLEARRIVA